MGNILNKMFSNKKLSILLPLVLAAIVYVLFVLFGTSEEKTKLMIITPIVTAIFYFGLFLGIFMQVKSPFCPERLLNFFELFFTACFGITAVINALLFFISGFQDFTVISVAGITTYSAVAWAHSKR